MSTFASPLSLAASKHIHFFLDTLHLASSHDTTVDMPSEPPSQEPSSSQYSALSGTTSNTNNHAASTISDFSQPTPPSGRTGPAFKDWSTVPDHFKGGPDAVVLATRTGIVRGWFWE